MRFLNREDTLCFYKFGKIIYSDCLIRESFLYGDGVARHLFYKFWLHSATT